MQPLTCHRLLPARDLRQAGLTLAVLATVFCGALAWQESARAGGPILVGGTGPAPLTPTPGQPFTHDTSTPLQYRTDGGTLGKLSTANANNRVAAMFQVWQDVSTASISFTRLGALKATGAFTGGDVDTMAEYNAVEGSCGDERQNPAKQSPIVYDADGSLFSDLGYPDDVIGFASPCLIGVVGGQNRLLGGLAALNGKFLDNISNPANPELTDNQFNEVFVHEFGHLAGLDHSQINLEVLSQPANNCSLEDLAGLPLMFPFLHCQDRPDAGLPQLAPDDIAWISSLYRDSSFTTEFGFIEGKILFSDATTHVQGGNVIARQVDNLGTPENESRRNAVSVVSGYKFTGNPGQSVTCTDPANPTSQTCTNLGGSDFGSRDPTLVGFYEVPLKPASYTVEVESIDPEFVIGSAVGPLGADAGEQIPLPGPAEFWDQGESATDDPLLSTPVPLPGPNLRIDKDIILNGTPTRFDAFESAHLCLPACRPACHSFAAGRRLEAGGREPAPAWVRREIPFDRLAAAKLWQAGLAAAKLWQAGLVTG